MLQNGVYTATLSGKSHIEVRVVLRRGSKLDTFVQVDHDRRPAVTHFVSLGAQSVTVVDLYGNQPGDRWHRVGLGALAVNTAITFLGHIYPVGTPVRGHIVDARDLHRQEQRRAFWRSFGFDITAPDRRGEEHLQGVVGRLQLVEGLVLDEHPRILDLSAFTQVTP